MSGGSHAQKHASTFWGGAEGSSPNKIGPNNKTRLKPGVEILSPITLAPGQNKSHRLNTRARYAGIGLVVNYTTTMTMYVLGHTAYARDKTKNNAKG